MWAILVPVESEHRRPFWAPSHPFRFSSIRSLLHPYSPDWPHFFFTFFILLSWPRPPFRSVHMKAAAQTHSHRLCNRWNMRLNLKQQQQQQPHPGHFLCCCCCWSDQSAWPPLFGGNHFFLSFPLNSTLSLDASGAPTRLVCPPPSCANFMTPESAATRTPA